MSGRKKGSKKRLSDVVDDAIKSDKEEDKHDDANEQKRTDAEKKDEEEKKPKYPIAPDGYLPNSVIRQIIRPKAATPVANQSPEEPWKLKPVPIMDPRHQVDNASRVSDNDITLYLSETSMSNPNENADDRSQEFDEVTAVQVHRMSRESTNLPGQEQYGDGQQNPLQSESTTLSKRRPLLSALSRQATKTSAISEEDSKVKDVLREIGQEPWYPKGTECTLSDVVGAFREIMDDAEPAIHKEICDYIVRINEEIGYPETLLDKISEALRDQLASPVMEKRVQAVETLGKLGISEKHVTEGTPSLPADPNISDERHQSAEDALIKSTGARDKEALDKRVDEIGPTTDQRAESEDEKEDAKQTAAKSRKTDEKVTVLPEASQDQLIETWLEGTKGVEKDLTGLYREDSEAESKKSENIRGRRSPEVSEDREHSEKSTPREDVRNKLSIPDSEKQHELKSHFAVPKTTKLTPNNPQMYKMYDSQRQALMASPEKPTKVTRFEDSATEKTAVEDDSGLGQELDSSSYSREKSGALRPGTTNLSPVQGSELEESENIAQQDEVQVDTANWRMFFDHAPKHKDQTEQRQDEASRITRDPISLPPIRYLGEDVEMVPCNTGQRLVQSVSVKSKRSDSACSSASGSTTAHRIKSLPSRLGTNTARESPDSCSRTNSVKFLPALVQHSEPEYEWSESVAPPPPDKKPTLGTSAVERESKHYCEYSRLLKKRMHHHISIGRYLGNKRVAEIASDLTIPLSTAKGIEIRLAVLRLSMVH